MLCMDFNLGYKVIYSGEMHIQYLNMGCACAFWEYLPAED